MVAIGLAYFVTLSLFPGIESEVPSCQLRSWMPVLLISVFNLFDFLGKVNSPFYCSFQFISNRRLDLFRLPLSHFCKCLKTILFDLGLVLRVCVCSPFVTFSISYASLCLLLGSLCVSLIIGSTVCLSPWHYCLHVCCLGNTVCVLLLFTYVLPR